MRGKSHQTSHIHVRLEFSCELNERSPGREVSIQKEFVDVNAYLLYLFGEARACFCVPATQLLQLGVSPSPQFCGIYPKNFLATVPVLKVKAVGAFTVRCASGWRGPAEEPVSRGSVGPAASRLGRWLPDACTRSGCLGGPFLQPSFGSCSRRCSLESVSSAFQIFLQAIQYCYYIISA